MYFCEILDNFTFLGIKQLFKRNHLRSLEGNVSLMELLTYIQTYEKWQVATTRCFPKWSQATQIENHLFHKTFYFTNLSNAFPYKILI